MVYVIDDDSSVRLSLENLLHEAEMPVVSFESAQEFLKYHFTAPEPCCLLLDISLPDANGLDLYQSLSKTGDAPPVIFITGDGTVSMSVKAMKAGAFDFILKPFDYEELLAVIVQALEKDRLEKQASAKTELLQSLVDHLTDRELQVFQAVSEGLLNKQISARLHIVEQTVKVHRARMMKKLHANSVAAVVHIAEQLSRSGRLVCSSSMSLLALTCEITASG